MSFTTGGGVSLEALSDGEATVTFTAGAARAVVPVRVVENLWVLPAEDYESDEFTVRVDRASGRVSAHFEPMALQDKGVSLQVNDIALDAGEYELRLDDAAPGPGSYDAIVSRGGGGLATARGDGIAARFTLESRSLVGMGCRFSFNRQGADYEFTPVLVKV